MRKREILFLCTMLFLITQVNAQSPKIQGVMTELCSIPANL